LGFFSISSKKSQRCPLSDRDRNAAEVQDHSHVTVYELNDGTVQVRHNGKVLAMTVFSKEEARITQGAIVSNKLLSGVLQHIKDKQAKKDSEKVVKLHTKRDKRLLLHRAKAVA
jgi:hypothetical protein